MSKAEVIQSHVEICMRELLGLDELYVCPDGAIPVHFRSARYVVRVKRSGRTPHVEVSSVMIEDVDADPGLYEAINEINRRLSHLRAFWADRKVIVAGELFGPAVDRESLDCVCDEISEVAHHEGPRLAGIFGGRVQFPDEVGEDE